MIEQPPTTDGQLAGDIRSLFARLVSACNAASIAGLDVDVKIEVRELRGLTRDGRKVFDGDVSVKREVG